MSNATLPLPLGIQRAIYGQRTGGSDIPPVGRFRLLVASVVLGEVVAVGAIAFLAACQVVTRLALTQCAGYQPGGPAGETVLVPSAVGGSPRVWLLVAPAVRPGRLGPPRRSPRRARMRTVRIGIGGRRKRGGTGVTARLDEAHGPFVPLPRSPSWSHPAGNPSSARWVIAYSGAKLAMPFGAVAEVPAQKA
jgi:hypothetical protein